MVFQDISLGKDLENQENPWENVTSSTVTNSDSFVMPEVGKERVEALIKSIDEIKELIDGREKLSKRIFSEGEKMKMEITNFLNENRVRDVNDPIETQERSALRQKKIDIAQMQLNEKVACWKDVALLKKELRDKEQDLSEKLARMNILEGILESTSSDDNSNDYEKVGGKI